MFSLMKMFGKTRKSGARKNKSKSKSRTKTRVVRRTRKSRTAKKVKKGGMIPFI